VSRQLDDVLMPQRFGAVLLGLFSVIALGVAAIGIYSVCAYAVVQRTPELGVRIALGAQRGDVLRSVFRRVAPAALAGMVAGLLAAGAATRVLEPFLFGVTSRDATAYAGAAIAICVAALAAAWGPARRATRIDPIRAIRAE
jgi:ABC-type antimicrobial peptide transport system permease subunit